eukprot:1199418-Pyramimonas_sp.AAC.1
MWSASSRGTGWCSRVACAGVAVISAPTPCATRAWRCRFLSRCNAASRPWGRWNRSLIECGAHGCCCRLSVAPDQ